MTPHKTSHTIQYLLIMVFFLMVIHAFFIPHAAAQEFVPIEPLPGVSYGGSREGLFAEYASNAFDISIGLAALLAVLMIVVGGIQYTVTAVSESAKKDAKDRIWGALWGLLIVLSAWLILNTINPDLVSLDIFRNVDPL